jgi:antirestriction protein
MSDLRIYVASLSDYNAGILHGVWIDIDGKDADAIQEEVNKMLAESPAAKKYGDVAEEWAIHDYEGFPKLEESTDFETIAEMAELIEEHDGAFLVALENFSGDIEDAKQAVTENYAGTASSLAEWAEDFTNETNDLSGMPDFLRYHIDWEGVARDMELNGDIWSGTDSDGTLHIFWNR